MTAATTPLTGSELVPLIQSGGNVQTTVFQLGMMQYSVLASNFSQASQTTLQASSIQLPVVIGTYWIELSLYVASNPGGGGKIGFSTSTNVVASVVSICGQTVNSTGNMTPFVITSVSGTGTGVALASPQGTFYGGGIITFTTGGTLNLGFAQVTSNGGASTLNAGSSMRLTRLA